MERADYERLIHIRDYCREIRKTLQRYGAAFQNYEADSDYQRSLAFSILQIGELASHLSEDFRKSTASAIQWSPIRGMRNVVVHGYEGVDHMVIWETATIDIPVLEKFCDKQIQSVKSQDMAENTKHILRECPHPEPDDGLEL